MPGRGRTRYGGANFRRVAATALPSCASVGRGWCVRWPWLVCPSRRSSIRSTSSPLELIQLIQDQGGLDLAMAHPGLHVARPPRASGVRLRFSSPVGGSGVRADDTGIRGPADSPECRRGVTGFPGDSRWWGGWGAVSRPWRCWWGGTGGTGGNWRSKSPTNRATTTGFGPSLANAWATPSNGISLANSIAWGRPTTICERWRIEADGQVGLPKPELARQIPAVEARLRRLSSARGPEKAGIQSCAYRLPFPSRVPQAVAVAAWQLSGKQCEISCPTRRTGPRTSLTCSPRTWDSPPPRHWSASGFDAVSAGAISLDP